MLESKFRRVINSWRSEVARGSGVVWVILPEPEILCEWVFSPMNRRAYAGYSACVGQNELGEKGTLILELIPH